MADQNWDDVPSVIGGNSSVENVKMCILNKVEDLASDFLYYDRKNDCDLRPGEIEQAVIAGEITVDEIVERFRKQVENAVAGARRGSR